jgi:hypothetical protein
MSAGVLCDYSIESLPFTYASTRAYHSLVNLYLIHRINEHLGVMPNDQGSLAIRSPPRR